MKFKSGDKDAWQTQNSHQSYEKALGVTSHQSCLTSSSVYIHLGIINLCSARRRPHPPPPCLLRQLLPPLPPLLPSPDTVPRNLDTTFTNYCCYHSTFDSYLRPYHQQSSAIAATFLPFLITLGPNIEHPNASPIVTATIFPPTKNCYRITLSRPQIMF